jgi:hypothetical protein
MKRYSFAKILDPNTDREFWGIKCAQDNIDTAPSPGEVVEVRKRNGEIKQIRLGAKMRFSSNGNRSHWFRIAR